MICFNKNSPHPEDDGEFYKKLQQALDEIYFDQKLEEAELNIAENSEIIEDGNISNLIEVVYDKFYNENSQCLGIVIEKNKNGSLKIIIDEIE